MAGLLAGVIGYAIRLPVNPPVVFPCVQVGPDRREYVERAGKSSIWITVADMLSMRTDREGNIFYTVTPENKKFLEFRFDPVDGLDNLTDRELAEKVNESIRELQARTLVAQQAGANHVGAALDLTALASEG
jgi:hypothetical protein